MIKSLPLLVLIFMSMLISCGKENDSPESERPIETPENPQVPGTPGQDTLSSGWTKKKISDEALLDIKFQDSQIGYCGGIFFYHTTDGGASWNRLTNPASTNNLFITPNGNLHGMNITADAIFRYRRETGEHSIFQVPTPRTSYGDLYFLNDKTGFAIHISGLYATTDSGTSYSKIDLTGLNMQSNTRGFAINFQDENTGVLGIDNAIYRSEGSISKWVLSNQPSNDTALINSFSAPMPGLVYAGLSNAVILRSTDGGINFTEISRLQESVPYRFNDIHFLDANNGYACYANRIFKTSNGGVSWTKVVSLINDRIIEIDFTDANHGWACTANGMVLRYKK